MKTEIAAYLRHGHVHGWSEQTLINYGKRLKDLSRFLSKVGRKNLVDVVQEDLDEYMLYASLRGLKRKTLVGLASTAKCFFRWLEAEGRILASPGNDIPAPDAASDLPIPPLEEADVAEILDNLPRRNAIDLRNRLHVELLYGAALRIGESVKLDVDDLNLSRRTVHVRNGKGGKQRTLPMLGGVCTALRDYLAVRGRLLRGPDDGALLLSRRGRRMVPQALREFLRKLNADRAGKQRLFPHLFRHSSAVHLLRGGADIRHVQQFLGHAMLETTKIYLRIVPGALKAQYLAAMPEIVLVT